MRRGPPRPTRAGRSAAATDVRPLRLDPVADPAAGPWCPWSRCLYPAEGSRTCRPHETVDPRRIDSVPGVAVRLEVRADNDAVVGGVPGVGSRCTIAMS